MRAENKAGAATSSGHGSTTAEIDQILREQKEWLDRTQGKSDLPPALMARLRALDLRSHDFSKQSLRNADLHQLDLTGANFRGADLTGTTLSGSTLVRADFQGAELYRTSFHDADLRLAKLKESHSLSVDALGGADLTSADLSDDIKSFAGLDAAAEVGGYVQSLFKITLALTAYVAITMASSSDPELLNTNGTGSMRLPFLEAPMPTFWFNWIGPCLLLLVNLYALTYLKMLHAILSFLPAIFPDGSTLDKRVYPTNTNTLIRYHFLRLTNDKTWAGNVHRWIALYLSLWLVPTALSTVWLRCLSAHDWNLTGIQVGMWGLAVFASLWTYAIAVTALGRGNTAVPPLRLRWERLACRRGFYTGVSLALVVSAILFSEAAFRSVNPQTVYLVYGDKARLEGAQRWERTFVPACFSFLNRFTRFTHLPFADFENRDVSERPAGTARQNLTSKELETVKGASLEGANLRFSKAFDAFFVKANLYGADLQEADLREANLQHADLRAASLRHAVLREATLISIDGRGADFTHAYLKSADLSHADLRRLQDETIYRSTKPRRSGAAVFDLAMISQANLSHANLTAASFRGADLSLANFDHATLDGADFRPGITDTDKSRIETQLTGADFSGASLKQTDFRQVDLRGVKNLTTDQLKEAICDASTQLPVSLSPSSPPRNGPRRENQSTTGRPSANQVVN
jgi:uncharacterized protein YjbI with pentapeptide repeats